VLLVQAASFTDRIIGANRLERGLYPGLTYSYTKILFSVLHTILRFNIILGTKINVL
jgi:hypothetical protein